MRVNSSRVVRRGLRKLSSGGLRERLGSARNRAPSALLDTGELTPRSTQRVEALSTVLRSVAIRASCVGWSIWPAASSASSAWRVALP